MGINKDQVDGRVKEAAGKVQEVAGRVTGSPTQELKGKVKKTVGARAGRVRRCEGAGQEQRSKTTTRTPGRRFAPA